MHLPRGARDLELLKWIGVILPIVFIWVFELVRFFVVEENVSGTETNVVSALVMAGAVVLFGMGMAALIDRTERELVRQNRDLTATRAASAAVRGDRPLGEALDEALDGLVRETGAVAGIVRVPQPEGGEFVRRQPMHIPAGLDWAAALLDEDPPGHPEGPRYSERRELDTILLDLPLVRRGSHLGALRLVFHPAQRPDLSEEALLDIGEELATAIRLARLVDDLRRRERERAALYEVALQLTERRETRPALDGIAAHARELLAADRAVVCLVEPSGVARAGLMAERRALAEDGSVCTMAHLDEGVGFHRDPLCPARLDRDGVRWMARPLRSAEGQLGELCVVREHGPDFSEADRSLLTALADMAAIAVTTARLKEAEQQWTIVAERDRIARELHDSLAQVLGHIHLRLRDVETRLDGAAPIIGAELSDLAGVADEAYRDVREAILGLRETISSEGGLEGALREYIAKYARQTGIKASLACDETARTALPPRAEVQLLRVVQEALTNVRKHAGASRVVVRMRCPDGMPIVEVEDDGRGFDPAGVGASFSGGFGLSSMRERVEQVGGTLELHTSPGSGTRIVVRLQPEDPRVTPATASPDPAGR
ncbi:MAG TPA: GAF domain-containing sensor histidine kinase [Candidatus Limnocylindrales bacterium]|nr:GAF domain-containing sensor histidine kinase [Candidatus Limnocylindrales bacterium]